MAKISRRDFLKGSAALGLMSASLMGCSTPAETPGTPETVIQEVIKEVEKEVVKDVVKVIEDVCKRRKEMVSTPAPTTIGSGSGMYMPYPIEVEVGGATVFVLDVDQFYKV